MELIRVLKAKQRGLRESDRAFAKRLGISTGTWSVTTRGKRKYGPAIIDGAFRAFPNDAAIEGALLTDLGMAAREPELAQTAK